MAITSDELLNGVQKRIAQPSVRSLLSNEDMLSMADDVIRHKMIPLMKSVSQNYFVVKSEPDTIISGQQNYSIPYRAIGRTLRDLKIQDPGGNVWNLPLIALEDEYLFTNPGSGIPVGFFFLGDLISLVPVPGVDNYSLLKMWELPPGELVVVNKAALIDSISIGVSTTDVVVTSLPTDITTSTPIDFIQGLQGCRTLGMDVSIQGIAGTTLTFDNDDIPTGLTEGDWICLATTSPVVQLPNEAYPLLETSLGKEILSAVGDFEGVNKLSEDEKEQEKALKILMEPRITGEQTKIINRRGLVWTRFGRRYPTRIV